MARKPYQEDQSIHSMTTRQLRQYIADQADEAEARLKSAPSETSRAFDDLKGDITYRSGKVKRSTSYMTKAEMREYAYMLRTFNRFDSESGYEAKTDWQKNKKRYEKFVRNQIKSGNTYWERYLTKKDNISKKGYQDYKDFMSVIKAAEGLISKFGYENIQQYALDDKNELDPNNVILSKTINKVFLESQATGWEQKELLDQLKKEYDKALGKEVEKKNPKSLNIKTKKPKKSTSQNNIKVKTTRKMRTSERVHNKLS